MEEINDDNGGIKIENTFENNFLPDIVSSRIEKNPVLFSELEERKDGINTVCDENKEYYDKKEMSKMITKEHDGCLNNEYKANHHLHNVAEICNNQIICVPLVNASKRNSDTFSMIDNINLPEKTNTDNSSENNLSIKEQVHFYNNKIFDCTVDVEEDKPVPIENMRQEILAKIKIESM